jgi:copper(I)-binding protein
MTTMRPIRAVPLPANGTITFAPGGKHLMLFGVNAALQPGGYTLFNFTFADGSRMERKAWAIGASDPAPE